MTFIETVEQREATDAVAEMYAAERERVGHLPNYVKAFSRQPAVYAAWRELIGAIREQMDVGRFELATLAAARRLRSSYCMLAHGSVLLQHDVEPERLRAIVADHRAADLQPDEVAIMDLAEKVADDAASITQEDIDRLRSLGLSDADIAGVIMAAAARCFFSKTLDALGVEPDARFGELDRELREALTVGRPIALT